ncbi:YdbH domain-containing protein [Nitrosomonas sp. Nm166]|uniref:intermembrane phospholipid transport protein YdbH family protein n=1 Tax=Nitrosomonas sp. Nm166 TaxID=1881054 RepID=UPI0008EAF939|nr:YdbH domain-containing protein [Nitrosomonas sp. Nm166]SFE69293.1 Dicarboxylate transport [Nitrosomonas sp. Nm166]
MSKHLKTWLLILTSLIIIVGAGLYLFRHSLLEALISDQLRKQNIPLQSVSVLDVSLNALRLQGLTAGVDKEMRVDKILVTWDFSDLLAGKPIAIEISGLQIMLDLSKKPSLSDSLQSMTSATEKDLTIPWLPILSLRDSAIHFHSTAGDLTVALFGDITPGQSGNQAVHLSAIVSGSFAQTKVMLAATLDRQGHMQGKITVSEGTLNSPEIQISRFAGETTFALAARHLQLIQTEFMLSDIHLSAIPLPESVPEQTFKLDNMTINRLTLKGNARGSPLSGELDLNVDGGHLAAESVTIQQMSISLPLQVSLNQKIARVGLRNPGQIRFGKIDSSYDLILQGPLGFSISQANIEWAENILKHQIAVTPTNFTLLAKQEKSPAIEAKIRPGEIVLSGQLNVDKKYQGEVTLSNAALLLPQSHLQLKNISTNLHLGTTQANKIADFSIGQLQHLTSEPLFAPLSVSGSIRNEAVAGKPAVYALDIAGGVSTVRYLKITGKHASDSGNGMLKAEIVPLRFSPDGLQPDALSPLLGSLDDVSGLFSASALIKWSNEGMRDSHGAVELQNVSFAREAAKIDNLNVTLHIEDLLSPSSQPKQAITVQRIDLGIPLENLLVSYQIEDGESPRIILEKAQFSMMDGVVSLAPTVINPASARSEILIHIDNLNLTTFFDLIQVKGLTGSGHLDGDIPIILEEGNQVTIKNGRLAAKAPGILRLKLEKASQLLASAGEEINLLLKALQDFHYTELTLNLDKSVTHDLIVKLSLLGKNPEVKKGRSFRLNIKLETDIDKILETINQGYNLSHEILRGSLRLH